MNVIYVLPKENYFSEGPRGRVSHARGVADGLALQGVNVTVISGPQAKDHFREANVIEVGASKNWLAALFTEIQTQLMDASRPTTVITRYSSSNGYRFLSLFRKHPDVQWCFEVNSLMYHNRPSMPRILRKLALRVESAIVSKADCLYLVSQGLKRDISGSDGGERFFVVPNGGPPPISIGSKRMDRPFRFVYFGVLQAYYNFDTVVDGFLAARARGLDAELHVFGYGPQLAALEEMAQGQDSIIAHGRYDLQRLTNEELSTLDSALVLPYASADINDVGSPIKMFEYMATGLPIIASGSGGVEETLEHEKSALLVSSSDSEQWAEAMLRMRADAKLRAQLSAFLRENYASHTWQSRMAGLYAHITDIHARSNA